ncbi:MAG: adenosylcobinamide-phosphate synthase CbiB [Candidatus Competibacterales bacterium]
MLITLSCLAAVGLDGWLGEPRRHHPLGAFARLAAGAEALARRLATSPVALRGVGVTAVVALTLPLGLGAFGLTALPGGMGTVLAVALLYLTLGARSLVDHASPIAKALEAGDLPLARQRVAMIVSRDTEAMDEGQVAVAACESVLENGCDAVFGTLFWFAVAGAPGAVVYRAVNTLDALWGYKTPRYRDFGWAAARADDVLNWLPARLTAMSYALVGDAPRAVRCWRRQGRQWKSPNAGPVMAAGAGALGLALGGGAHYHGQFQPRPPLGEGRTPKGNDIRRAVGLVVRALLLWLGAIATLEGLITPGPGAM